MLRSLVCFILLECALASQLSSNSFSSVIYHGGPLLSSRAGINIYLTWYGAFSVQERAVVSDFFSSFRSQSSIATPTVASWWKITSSYKGKGGQTVSGTIKLAKQIGDIYSLGKRLKRAQIADIIVKNINSKRLPVDSNGVYFVLTSKDVTVDSFCMGSCGFHDFVVSSGAKLVYSHVGDPKVQCPGLCSWNYAKPSYGPPGNPLVAPNGVGVDGMIMNIATLLAGAATNPFKNGYFQGDPLVPLEAVTACPGVFGNGAYPGYPGELKMDKRGASFNAYSANGRRFLLPAIWDLSTSTCKAIR